MIHDGTLLSMSSCAIWVAQLCYFICFIPQIILNFKTKAAKGLSDLMVIGYLHGQGASLIYVFCLNLPIQFKVMTILVGLGLFTIIAQRFYYAQWDRPTIYIALNYIGTVCVWVILSVWALKYPITVGNIAGWIAFLLSWIQQIPQAIRIYQKKTTQGFSYSFILINALGNFIEFTVGIFIRLPLQTLLADLRGIIMFLIFSVQFWLYKK